MMGFQGKTSNVIGQVIISEYKSFTISEMYFM